MQPIKVGHYIVNLANVTEVEITGPASVIIRYNVTASGGDEGETHSPDVTTISGDEARALIAYLTMIATDVMTYLPHSS